MKYRIGSDQVIGKALDDEAVIINLATGIYYGLDGPAAKVWDYLSSGVSRERVARALGDAYPDEPGIQAALAALVDEMCAAGLLAVDEAQDADEARALEWPGQYQPLEMISYDDVAAMVALDPPLPELNHEMVDHSGRAQA